MHVYYQYILKGGNAYPCNKFQSVTNSGRSIDIRAIKLVVLVVQGPLHYFQGVSQISISKFGAGPTKSRYVQWGPSLYETANRIIHSSTPSNSKKLRPSSTN